MIKIYNSLSRTIEELVPLKDKTIGIYLCGPTVYGPDHLGHARTWIFFDWLRRYLINQGFKVSFVQNITDVGHLTDAGEDKIEKQAKAENKTPQEIAREYEKEHFKDLASLNILLPDHSPRASEYIDEMIKFIEGLIAKKHAYVSRGNVYFDVRSIDSYGQLSGRKIEAEQAGARVAIDTQKKNPADFALWLKADPSHIQKWPSPWGEGYPGWHLECSVLAPKHIGQPFDIHEGAMDLKFPHHENELAQSFAARGSLLAKYWLHSGMLLIDGQKMAKSLGNFITIKEILKDNHPDSVKLAFMTTFWRKPYDWHLKTTIEGARKLREKLVRAKTSASDKKTDISDKIKEALDDDFNVPKALSIIEQQLSNFSKADFKYIEEIFGLKLEDELKLSQEQEALLKEREEARKAGDYEKADNIRRKLAEQGIALEDTPTGPRLYRN